MLSWRSAMVRISCMIRTVLPTPEPPTILALPRWASGASRSIAVMALRKRGPARVQCRQGGRWIGARGPALFRGAPRSMGRATVSSGRLGTGSPTSAAMGISRTPRSASPW